MTIMMITARPSASIVLCAAAAALLLAARAAPAQETAGAAEAEIDPANLVALPDGRRMSKGDVLRSLLEEEHMTARDANGNVIDASDIVIEEDGTVRGPDGEALNDPTTGEFGSGGNEVAQPAAEEGEEDEQAEADEDDDLGPGLRPIETAEGIRLIVGGRSKDGIAKVGAIPVLD